MSRVVTEREVFDEVYVSKYVICRELAKKILASEDEPYEGSREDNISATLFICWQNRRAEIEAEKIRLNRKESK